MSAAEYALPPARADFMGKQASTHNLPAPVTSFVGRRQEVEEICACIGDPATRLIVITGPPGVGKTSLALQSAEKLTGSFHDGVRFVPLAAVVSVDQFLTALALSLDVEERAGGASLDRLRTYLSTKEILLLLDNCEQLEAPAAYLAALLASAPGLKILATSRTLLHVYGEHDFRAQPLQVPGTGYLHVSSDADVQSLSKIDSAALFVQRAQAANSSFRLTSANAASIAALCTRLDGLPLALELAAARARIFGPEAILAQIERRFDFLNNGALDLPARHQSLSAAIDWSYNLLTPDEQTVFNRLGVFVGGCTLDAAAAVANLEVRSPDLPPVTQCKYALPYIESILLDSLVSHNLLTAVTSCDASREHGANVLRFAMLETIREYALRRLRESGELDEARYAHVNYFLTQVECFAQGSAGEISSQRLDHLEAELDNLRSALEFCAHTPGAGDSGLRLAIALEPLWLVRNHIREGLQHLTATLSSGGIGADSRLRANALVLAGEMSSLLGKHFEAKPLLEESIQLFELTGDIKGKARALSSLGHVLVHIEDQQKAHALYQECLTARRVLGDEALVARSLSDLADLALCTGDCESAEAYYDEGLHLAYAIGNWALIADLSCFKSCLLIEKGRHKQAWATLLEAVERYNKHGARRSLAYCMALGAEVAFAEGYNRDAVQLFAAASVQFYQAGVRMEPPVHSDPEMHRRSIEELHSILGDEVFTQLWSVGQQMSLGEAIAFHRHLSEMEAAPACGANSLLDARPEARVEGVTMGLTGREVEVLRLVSTGLTNAEAATRLSLSPFTVNMHLRSIYSKLGVSSRTAATRYAVANRLV